MADNETILAALAAMDHTDDGQWLADGTPKTGAVQRLADDQTITRRDIEAAAPEFRRHVEAEPEPQSETAPQCGAASESLDLTERDSARHDEPDQSEQNILSVQEAQARVVESQVRLRAAYERQREARARVARAVARWQEVIGDRYTPEMAARDFIATGLAERAAGGGRRPRGTPGPSIVDQYAFGHGRSVNQGKYGAWKRGGLSITESTRRLNEAARAKLPSER